LHPPRNPAASSRHRTRILLAAALLIARAAAAQPASPEEAEAKSADAAKSFKPHFVFLPVLYYTPETRLAIGAGGVINYRFGADKEKARPSSLWVLFVYTLNSQIQMSLKPQVYFAKNSFILDAVLKYSLFPQKFYGIGNDVLPSAAEVYTPETYGFQLSLKRRVVGAVFGGIEYQLEKTIIQKVEPGGLLASGAIFGSQGGTISGLGLSINWDNRDNVFFPRRGSYFQLVADFYSRPLGSDYHYTVSRIDLRTYIPVFETHVVALQAYLRNMGGTPPFFELSMLGGASIMRGTYAGQYRDRALFAIQAEYRLPVWWRFGAVGFFGLGDVGSSLRAIKLNRLKYSVGGGLRFKMDTREGTNLRLDFAWGKASTGIYATVQEAF
jgi:outer membrane protein assembly factor BamA